jgi:hypothetical protein
MKQGSDGISPVTFMKPILTSVVLAAALLVGPSFAAQHESVSTHMGKFDEQSMQMHNDRMQMHLEEMKTLMDEMHATSDPAERRRLLTEHRIQMAELMGDMRSSREDMMMGMMGGGPIHGGPIPGGEKRRQYMIEKRLGMMDNAMEMMMQQDQMMMNR